MKKPPDADKWKAIGNWTTIIGLYNSDDSANNIVRAWLTSTSLDEKYTCQPIEAFLNNIPPRSPPESVEGFQLNFFM